MAFDQATRNRLSKFVTDTRKLLSDEFSQQLRVKYGLDPATGTVTDIDKLPTMAEGDRQTAQMLRDTLEHYTAATPTRDKKTIATTIDRIVREQAFTVLNRLCAVRMAEARDLVIESITRGTKSKGFQLYARLAGSALGETGDVYECYLFSLFDELSIELPVLFDRFSASGRLFPKESVLIEVLEQINHHELQYLWAEDETIGWIYQYFNSQDERREMRDASAAPRSSRELAVRNQFFTPRYVVEFLTDNTLGRIWCEMTQGQTRLVDDCKYLVRRQDEVFLSHMTGKDLEHPSDGTIAVAELLQSGTEDTFPEFNVHDHQPMIELAHCVSAYATLGEQVHEMPHSQVVLDVDFDIGIGPYASSVEAAPSVYSGQFSGVKTQHILEVLFYTCRADRHGGDGSVYSERWFVDACNEVRRRVLNSRRDELNQEELLRQPVLTPYRPVKDPRDIKMLDPACGSMHFGLYAFDLFLRIYEEAWELEGRLGDQAFVRPQEMKSLRDSYGTREKYMLDVPRLIIERNIHGIDIDARAVQIAGLSLWLRAQKAWHEAGVKPVSRPPITRSNIVCAEPMPGEADLLEQFITDHLSQTSEQQTIASIVRRVFDALKLAGEAGSLLKIEEEIAGTIAEAKKKWVEGPKALQLPLFAIDLKQKDSGARPLLVAGIDDASFWDDIEDRIYAALREYGEKAGGGFQRRLFANDAAQGFAFVDLCRKRYDLVVMNPPFGLLATPSKASLFKIYPTAKEEIMNAMILAGVARLMDKGMLGCIGNRTVFYLANHEEWRRELFEGRATLTAFGDLGHGVLDGALVETAAFVLRATPLIHEHSIFISTLSATDKQGALQESLRSFRSSEPTTSGVFLRKLNELTAVPGFRLAYSVPLEFLHLFGESPALDPEYGEVIVGLQTSDNDRFLRLAWEIDVASIGQTHEALATDNRKSWAFFAKGGEYSPYFSDIHLACEWRGDGRVMKAFASAKYGHWSHNIHHPEFYFSPGLTFSRRTASSFNPRILPAGCLFGEQGPTIFPKGAFQKHPLAMLAICHSRVFQAFVELMVASGDSAFSGSAARTYERGVIGRVPIIEPSVSDMHELARTAKVVADAQRSIDSTSETSRFYVCPAMFLGGHRSFANLQELHSALETTLIKSHLTCLEATAEVERRVCDLYGFHETTNDWIESEFGPHPNSIDNGREVDDKLLDEFKVVALEDDSTLISSLVASQGGSRFLTKKTYFSDRRTELLCYRFQLPPQKVLELCKKTGTYLYSDLSKVIAGVISYAIGAAFGRWDIRYATGERPAPVLSDPFAPLPVCPPGMFQGIDSLPISTEEGRRLLAEGDYPIEVAWDGILVDDSQHAFGIERAVRTALATIWGSRFDALEQDALDILGVSDLREWFNKPNGFFSDHLSQYSKSRRQAPIYWPISTDSGSYTLWIYYQRLSHQTLFTAINEYIDPKLKDVTEKLNSLRSKTNRSKLEEEELENLSVLSSELDDFRSELLRVGRGWKPNLNDGVQINAAPLWRFFRFKKWRETLKKTWEELEEGKYDWAHLALSLWPERVVRTAHKDRSIAIAHRLEETLWHEVEIKKSSKSGRVTVKYEWQSRELSEKELDAIVQCVKNGEFLIGFGENAKS